MPSLRYERYALRIKRVAAVKNFILRNKVVLSIALVATLATTGALLGTKGIVTEKGDITPEGAVLTYGETPTYEAESFMGRAHYEYSVKNSGVWTTEKPTMAGEYEARAVGEGSFGSTYGSVHTFTIAKKPLTLAYRQDEMDNGITYGEYPILNSEGLLDGHKAVNPKFSYLEIEGNKVDISFKGLEVHDANGNDVTNNYEIPEIGKTTFKLNPRKLAFSNPNVTVIYNNEETVNGSDIHLDRGTLAFEDKITYEAAKGLTVGTYLGSDITIKDSLGKDVTYLYDISGKVGSLLIEKRDIKLETIDIVKEYDGKPLSGRGEVIIGGYGLAKGDGFSFEYLTKDEEIILPGEYSNDFDFNLDNEPNYNIDKQVGSITVNKRALGVTILDNGWTYAGTPLIDEELGYAELDDSYYRLSGSGLVEGDEFHLYVSGDIYTEPVFDYAITRGEETVTPLYEVTVDGNSRFYQAALMIMGQTETIVYDGKPHEPRFEVSGLQGEDKMAYLYLDQEVTSITRPGDLYGRIENLKYQIVNGEEDRTIHYLVTPSTAYVEVVKRPLQIAIQLNPLFEYFGEESPYRTLVKGKDTEEGILDGDFDTVGGTSLAEGDELVIYPKEGTLFIRDENDPDKYKLGEFEYDILNQEGESVLSCYEVAPLIDRNDTHCVGHDLTVKGLEDIYVYDGQEHQLRYELIGSFPNDQYEVTFGEGVTTSILTPGKIQGTPYINSIINPNLEEESTYDYYRISYEGGCSVTVLPRPILIDSVAINREYDGEVASLDVLDNEITYKEEGDDYGLLEGDSFHLVMGNNPFEKNLNVADYRNYASWEVLSSEGDDVTSCYEFIANKTDYLASSTINVIRPKYEYSFAYEVDEQGNYVYEKTIVYDGLEHQSGIYARYDTLIGDDYEKLDDISIATGRHVGSYTSNAPTVHILGKDGSYRDIYYDIIGHSQNVTLNIAPRNVALSIHVNRSYEGSAAVADPTLLLGRDYEIRDEEGYYGIADNDILTIMATYSMYGEDDISGKLSDSDYSFSLGSTIFADSSVNDYSFDILHTTPINEKAVYTYLVGADDEGVLKPSLTLTYDGTAHNIVVTSDTPLKGNDSLKEPMEGYSSIKPCEKVVGYDPAKVIVVNEKGEDVTRFYDISSTQSEAKLVINKRDLHLNIAVSRVYDGSASSFSKDLVLGSDYTIGENNLASTDALSIASNTDFFALKESEKNSTSIYELTINSSSEGDLSCYNPIFDSASWDVTRIALEWHVYSNNEPPYETSSEYYFAGTTYSVFAYSPQLVSIDAIEYKPPISEGEFVQWGKHTFTTKIERIYNANNKEDRTIYYSFDNTEQTVTIDIKPRVVELDINVARAYNGNASDISKTLANNEWSIYSGSLLSGHTLTITSNKDFFLAEWESGYTFKVVDDEGNDYSEGYDFSIHNESVSATKATLNWNVRYEGINAANATIPYDDVDRLVKLNYDGLKGTDKINLTTELPNNPVNMAGTYSFTTGIDSITSADGEDRSLYYKDYQDQQTINLTINPLNIDFHLTIDRTYDGSEDSISREFGKQNDFSYFLPYSDSFVVGHSWSITLAYDPFLDVDHNFYLTVKKDTLNGTIDVSSCYSFGYSYDWHFTKQELTSWNVRYQTVDGDLDPNELTYDGSYHQIVFDTVGLCGLDEITPSATLPDSVKDVGVYQYQTSIGSIGFADNKGVYHDRTLCYTFTNSDKIANLTINPRTVKFIINVNRNYDGTKDSISRVLSAAEFNYYDEELYHLLDGDTIEIDAIYDLYNCDHSFTSEDFSYVIKDGEKKYVTSNYEVVFEGVSVYAAKAQVIFFGITFCNDYFTDNYSTTYKGSPFSSRYVITRNVDGHEADGLLGNDKLVFDGEDIAPFHVGDYELTKSISDIKSEDDSRLAYYSFSCEKSSTAKISIAPKKLWISINMTRQYQGSVPETILVEGRDYSLPAPVLNQNDTLTIETIDMFDYSFFPEGSDNQFGNGTDWFTLDITNSYLKAQKEKDISVLKDYEIVFEKTSYEVHRANLDWIFGYEHSYTYYDSYYGIDREVTYYNTDESITYDGIERLAVAKASEGYSTWDDTITITTDAKAHKNAGSYSDKATLESIVNTKGEDVGKYYYVTSKEKTANLTINTRSVTIYFYDRRTEPYKWGLDGELGFEFTYRIKARDDGLDGYQYDYFFLDDEDNDVRDNLSLFITGVYQDPLYLSVYPDYQEVNYDGQPHSPEPNLSNLASGDKVVAYAPTKGPDDYSFVDPGRYYVSHLPSKIIDALGQDITYSYRINESGNDFVILKTTIDVRLNINRTYQGNLLSTALSSSEYTIVTEGINIKNLVITPKEDTILTDKPVEFTVKLGSGETIEDFDKYFTVNFTDDSVINFNKAQVTVSGTDEEFDYDGKSHTPQGQIVGLKYGDKAVLSLVNEVSVRRPREGKKEYEIKDVSFLKNVKGVDTDISKYYDLTISESKGTISVIEGSAKIELGDYYAVYDGVTSYDINSLIPISNIVVPGLDTGHYLKSIRLIGTFSEAGVHDLNYENIDLDALVIVNAQGEDVTQDYMISGVVGSLTLAKIGYEIYGSSVHKTYDGVASIDAKINSLKPYLIGIDTKNYDAAFSSVDDYSIQAIFHGDLEATEVGETTIPMNSGFVTISIKNKAGQDIDPSVVEIVYGSDITVTIDPRPIVIYTDDVIDETGIRISFGGYGVEYGSLLKNHRIIGTNHGDPGPYFEETEFANDAWNFLIVDENGTDVSHNYSITYDYGTISIEVPEYI